MMFDEIWFLERVFLGSLFVHAAPRQRLTLKSVYHSNSACLTRYSVSHCVAYQGRPFSSPNNSLMSKSVVGGV